MPDLNIWLDHEGFIRRTAPAPATLAGKTLEPGHRLRDLVPDLPPWETLSQPAAPVQVTLGTVQTALHLQPDGDDWQLSLWARHGGLPDLLDHLAVVQRTLLEARSVDEATDALLTFLHSEVYGAALCLHDPAENVLITRARVHFDEARLRPYHRIPLDAALPPAEAFRLGTELWLDRGECQRRYPELSLSPDTRQLVAFPLRTAERTLGVLVLSLDRTLPRDPNLAARLRVLTSFCAAALDRAQLFDTLRLTEARHRTLLETTHAFVWEVDADFRVQRPLPQWEAFSGQPFGAYRDYGYLASLPPDTRRRYLNVIRDATRRPRHLTFDLQVIGAGGSLMHGQVQAVPIHAPDGRLQAWMGTMVDVTERRQMERRQAIIQQVLQQLGAAVQPLDVLQAVMHVALAATRGQAARLVRLGLPGGTVQTLAQHPPDRPSPSRPAAFPTDPTLLRAALAAGLPSRIAVDGTLHPDQGTRDSVTATGGPRSVLAVPMQSDAGFEVLLLIAGAPDPLSPDARDHLHWVQPYLGRAAQRALLSWTLERREEQGRRILDALEEALVLCDEDGTVQQANGTALRLAGLDRVEDLPSIFDPLWELREPDGRLLGPSEYPASRALATGQAVRDVLIRRETPGGVQWMSMNAVPWQQDDGRRGVIVSVQDVTEPHRLRRQLEEQAQQDELTRLPNRRGFNRAVQALTAHPAGGAVLLLDLDRFKLINDTYGHHIGDALLQVIARRLRAQVSGGVCSRLAGDEFGVVLPGMSAQGARALVSHLLFLLEQPVSVHGVTLYPQVSIGLCVNAAAGWDAAAWFKGADLALHDAKEQGRSRWSEYSDTLAQRHARRVAIEDRLRLALQTRGLSVHYQPIEQCGQPGWLRTEALARWNDTQLGPVAPDEFIPVAEDSGLITSLGEHILRTALQQVHRWSRATREQVQVHVNVSAAQLKTLDFADRVAQILSETGCHPSQLVVELTESEAIGNVQAVIRQLLALQDLGVGIALDDFGTGNSSLSMLEQLPVQSVKIDRSFVRQIDATPRRQSLLSAMLLMGRELGVEVIVEGVETGVERRVLDRLGAQFVQGYHVSRPLSARQLRPGPDGLEARVQIRKHTRKLRAGAAETDPG
ncbi:hypothetical protein Ddep01_01868 [Deinococcus depolymerans]|uniref:EAL domain-containing protein n=1 Tax=Deinococcus depolymerans TaxID=392408 RepID=UPI00309A6024